MHFSLVLDLALSVKLGDNVIFLGKYVFQFNNIILNTVFSLYYNIRIVLKSLYAQIAIIFILINE